MILSTHPACVSFAVRMQHSVIIGHIFLSLGTLCAPATLPKSVTFVRCNDEGHAHVGQSLLNKWTYKVRRATWERSPWCLHLGEVAYESAWPRPGGSRYRRFQAHLREFWQGFSNADANMTRLPYTRTLG
jgi:hypothetical protein